MYILMNMVWGHAGENVNKNGDVSAEEEQFPSENNLNDDAYERWGGGILAIGTFGYDPLMKDENEDTYNINDYFSSEEEEEDGGDSSELEEKNPLVLETQDLMETEMEGNNWSDEEELQFGYEYMMMKKKERTTLADLFTADGDQKQGKVLKKEVSDYKPKTADFLVKGKPNRKSFANKLEARPIQKLNKVSFG